MKKTLYVVTSLIVLLCLGLSIEHFLDENHYNPGYDKYPVVISLHVALGGMYVCFATVQLFAVIRKNAPKFHRVLGTTTVSLGLITSAMAVAVTILFPFSGPAMIFFVTPFACYFAYALTRGYLFARKQEYGRHREWMIRAFAIATAIATQRLILVPALVVFGTEEDTIRLLSMLSFTSAFALHAVVSEYWLYTTRKKNALPIEFST